MGVDAGYIARPVALRKESVDRNPLPRSGTARGMVALRKESVDRNVIDWAKII